MDEGQLQYFFPYQKWVEPASGLTMEADWLYRNYPLENESEPRTIFNFSLISKDPSVLHGKEIESLTFTHSDGTEEWPLQNLKMLFADQSVIRFTSWINSEDFYDFVINSENPAVIIKRGGRTLEFEASGSAYRNYRAYIINVFGNQ